MSASPEHIRYADALITAGINAFAKTGKSTRKRQMVAAARAAAGASMRATIKKDKKLRPSAPKSWNSATAADVNKKIEDIVWKEVKKAYRQALREKANLDLPDSEIPRIMTASLLGFAFTPNVKGGKALSRRAFVTGAVAVTGSAVFFGSTNSAMASNKGLIRSISKDVKAYVKSKYNSIVARMKQAI